MLNAIRPLDQPALWLLPMIDEANPVDRCVVEAANILIEDGHARQGSMPHWEVVAFWHATQVIRVADAVPSVATRLASFLHHHLEVWRESFRTALALLSEKPDADAMEFLVSDPEGGPNDLRDQWFGFRSDLRHAGARDAALEMLKNPAAHPSLRQSQLEGIRALARDGSYLLPSCMQGRLDKFRAQPSDAAG